ncbi:MULTISPECIES: SAM-dependent methyltransferase [unclassified Streptomyces]|uniref:SAM-dependent methyltransferase n=1 Tax=unclassified Streptomyces TaxID=2593676 RepID=UPI000690A3F7|nr:MULTISPECIES: class I SAM-dependent methyltransferase [unclassified Streptomyces]
MDVPRRLAWAVDLLAPGPGDRVLEIGCGRGVAAGLLCARLTSGTVTAVDRSVTAVEAARRRNREAVETGRAAFHVLSLEDADFAAGSFDRVLAVNVNLFWTRRADPELAALRRWLAPGGLLCLCWEPPDGRAGEIAGKAERAVAAHGFETTTVRDGGLVGVLGALSGEGRTGKP